jgi:hypothetical protein
LAATWGLSIVLQGKYNQDDKKRRKMLIKSNPKEIAEYYQENNQDWEMVRIKR